MNIIQLERSFRERAKALQSLAARAMNTEDLRLIHIRIDNAMDMAEVLRLCQQTESGKRTTKKKGKA